MGFKANARLAFSEDVENGEEEEDGDDKLLRGTGTRRTSTYFLLQDGRMVIGYHILNRIVCMMLVDQMFTNRLLIDVMNGSSGCCRTG
ncbi:hypothetical protein Hanom_Chr09g00779451 [Helianthus anomalus]